MRRVVAVLVVAGTALFLWRALGSSPAGPPYASSVGAPTWPANGPAVLIDNAHWNDARADGRLTALAGLLAADGYRVLPGANATRAETLVDTKVAVIANPLGVVGAVRRWVTPIGIGDWPTFDDDALISQEIETTIQWIENGGSMLIAADPAPFARGVQGLTARLGVRVRGRLVVDVGHAEARDPSWLVFSRENTLVGSHPIVDGCPDAPPVNRVVAFGGHALEPPPDAAVLLRLSPSAAEVARAGDPPTSGQPVGGLALAVALERGRGRVVVLADTHLLTLDPQTSGAPTGLAWPGSNNERFVRYVMRWLSRRDAARH
jgi:hypothetical protein